METENQNEASELKDQEASGGSRIGAVVSYSSNTVGPKLLELIGVPNENCIRAVIRLEVNEAIIVDAEYYAGMALDSNTGELRREIRRYRLVSDE